MKTFRSPSFCYGIIWGLILFRSCGFVFWGKQVLESDEAVVGLMANRFLKGGSFPFFFSGQKYFLSLASWTSIPMFHWFGMSVFGLKFPLLLMNLIAGTLLFRLLKSEPKLSALHALLASSFFLLPSLASSQAFMSASWTCIIQFLVILLQWIFRKKPFLCGAMTGLAFLNRPFALYGAISLFWIRVLSGKGADTYKTIRADILRFALGFILIYSPVKFLATRSPYYVGLAGPGFYWKRLIFMLEDLRGYFADILPRMVGFQSQGFRLTDYLLLETGWTWLGAMSAALAFVIAVFFIHALLRENRFSPKQLFSEWRTTLRQDSRYSFPLYLLTIGGLSLFVFCAQSPPYDNIRYTMETLCAVIAIPVLVFLRFEKVNLPYLKFIKISAWISFCALMTANTIANAKALQFQIRTNSNCPDEKLIQALQSRNISTGIAEYWTAFKTDFLSKDEIHLAEPPTQWPRIQEYWNEASSSPTSARVLVSYRPCENGTPVERWYLCPLTDVTHADPKGPRAVKFVGFGEEEDAFPSSTYSDTNGSE